MPSEERSGAGRGACPWARGAARRRFRGLDQQIAHLVIGRSRRRSRAYGRGRRSTSDLVALIAALARREGPACPRFCPHDARRHRRPAARSTWRRNVVLQRADERRRRSAEREARRPLTPHFELPQPLGARLRAQPGGRAHHQLGGEHHLLVLAFVSRLRAARPGRVTSGERPGSQG
jgi:hypothetical protein